LSTNDRARGKKRVVGGNKVKVPNKYQGMWGSCASHPPSLTAFVKTEVNGYPAEISKSGHTVNTGQEALGIGEGINAKRQNSLTRSKGKRESVRLKTARVSSTVTFEPGQERVGDCQIRKWGVSGGDKTEKPVDKGRGGQKRNDLPLSPSGTRARVETRKGQKPES